MVRNVWLIRAMLAVFALGAVAALWRLDPASRISTDVLDLIPEDEREPELALVRALAGEQSARVTLFALGAVPEAKAAEVATAFMESLQQSEAFAEVVALSDRSPRNELGRQLFAQRFDLLLPGWLAARHREFVAETSRTGAGGGEAAPTQTDWSAWLANHVARSLDDFLQQPEALAYQDLLPADPLQLLPGLLSKVSPLAEPATVGSDRVLIWARAHASPMREEGQAPVFAAVEQALAAARHVSPDVTLRWSSIARFAAESRRRIQQELTGLNLLSLLAVFVVGAAGLRRLRDMLHLVPVVAGGLLGAWLATLLSFDRVHVLVFVVGSLLAGVAVDYGFYLALQPPTYPGEPYADRVRRLLKPLLASALTTILGFSLLLFSELPLIRQLGVFVSAGLLCSLATALAWFAQARRPFVESRALARVRLPRTQGLRSAARIALGVGAAVALIGPWRLHWHDDIRELEIPAPELREEAAAVQRLFGQEPNRATYLTHGATAGAARAALEEFQQWHDQQHPDSPIASLGLIAPHPAGYAAMPDRLAGLERFVPELQSALAEQGFEAEAFEPFEREWEAWRQQPQPGYDAVVNRLSASLQGPLSLLLSITDERTWFMSVADHPPGMEPPTGTSTVGVRQLENLNRLFSRYRLSALQLSVAGLAALGLSVLALYGVRKGVRIFAVPAGACLFAFGLLGLMGQTLNLFHLLGAFLGVCLSHDYAIFSAAHAARGEERPPSVRLSALTTTASFSVLSLSQIPVVAALGSTVALIVVSALAIVELEPLAARRRAGSLSPSSPA